MNGNTMAAKRSLSKAEAKDGAAPKAARRQRKERKFPALTFEEALVLPEAIQKFASGQKVRRLTLFEKLDRSPDSTETRRLVTASGQYGMTRGSYASEYLELTSEGSDATSDEVAPTKKLEVRFDLAIKNQQPFNFLYEKLRGGKMPVKEVMADYLTEAKVEDDEKPECIDTFILNATFLGLLRTIAGAERLVPIEQALEEAPQLVQQQAEESAEMADISAGPKAAISPTATASTDVSGDFAKTCFYITPIGEENSEERQHSDFMMTFVIEPALKEFDLKLVRADQIGKPGMIGKQVIELILNSRLVIADLSFHNPNVFYELCLRHTTRLPTVQIKRTIDRIPFDLNQYRTIPIETRNPYTLYPKLQTYTAEVANQVRRALADSESGDNPISLFYPSAKLTWDEK
ncbi:MAG: hypothetical protein KIT09_35260 [Bryobacteraceae bacterium]|nr:hypothetical protein [Bryobacteraceae bacterium]